MVHNKYYIIIKEFLNDLNRSLYGRMLVKKINLSQKAIALTLDELEQMNLLKSTKVGNIKYYQLNLLYKEIKEIIVIAEIMNKMEFTAKQKKIATIFKTDTRIIGIFGSYAKSTQKIDSDIDLFIIGEKRNPDYEETGKLYDLDISCKYFTEQEFKTFAKKKNSLINEIVKNHIIIFGFEKWVNKIWSDYYDFN